MPTVAQIEGFRFFFLCSRENREPPHIHLMPLRLCEALWFDNFEYRRHNPPLGSGR